MGAGYIFVTTMSLVWTENWAGASMKKLPLLPNEPDCSVLCAVQQWRQELVNDSVSIKFSMTWLDKLFFSHGWRTMMQSHSCTPAASPWLISHVLYFSMIIQQGLMVIVYHAWTLCCDIQQARISACNVSHPHMCVVTCDGWMDEPEAILFIFHS